MTPLEARLAQPRVSRRSLLLAVFAAPVRPGVSGEWIVPRLNTDRLQVAAPHLHFLSGKPLDRLHNGASMAFDFQLTACADRPAGVGLISKILVRSAERFVMSYDLWEEKFSVSRLSQPSRAVSHLAAPAAEAWCLDNLALPTAGLAPDQSFWLRLELRAEDPRDRPAVVTEPGISLTRLIELFSRPSRSAQAAWLVDDGPFRLADLNRAKSRGSGAG